MTDLPLLIYAEDAQALLKLRHIGSARKWIASGKLGQPLRLARGRLAVRREDFEAALSAFEIPIPQPRRATDLPSRRTTSTGKRSGERGRKTLGGGRRGSRRGDGESRP